MSVGIICVSVGVVCVSVGVVRVSVGVICMLLGVVRVSAVSRHLCVSRRLCVSGRLCVSRRLCVSMCCLYVSRYCMCVGRCHPCVCSCMLVFLFIHAHVSVRSSESGILFWTTTTYNVVSSRSVVHTSGVKPVYCRTGSNKSVLLPIAQSPQIDCGCRSCTRKSQNKVNNHLFYVVHSTHRLQPLDRCFFGNSKNPKLE